MAFPRLAVLLLALLALPVAAIERFEGDLPGGTGRFAIDVPAAWRPGDTLIVYNHGFSMRFPEQVGQVNTAPNGTLRNRFLADGLALAATSYSSRGWALFDIEREQRALLAEFRRVAGEPGRILLFGGSLGGLVSLRTAESFVAEGEPVAGVLAVCPPMAGARTWDSAVDARLLFDAVCENHPLPAGSDHLPWVIDYSEIPPNLSDITDRDTLENALPLANRIRQCMGFFQPAIFDTTAQLARRAQLKQLLGLDSDDFLLTNIAYSIYPLADLIQGPDKLDGHNAFDNRFVDYGDDAINARIRRIERDPLAAARLRAASDLRGGYGDAKLLVLHTDRDELVVPEHVEMLRQLDPEGRFSALALVAQESTAHCDFSAPELLAGIDSLNDWIDGGERPDAQSLDQRCEGLRNGDATARCGFDADIELSSLDQRIRPRNLPIRPILPAHSGTWFDAGHDGEGLLIELINDGRDAIVGWYTYPPRGESQDQRWIAGLGRVSEDGIHVGEAFEQRGARFGDFDPLDIQRLPWGELTLAFTGCERDQGSNDPLPPGQLRLRYSGPEAFGSGGRNLVQLTQNATSIPLCADATTLPPPEPDSAYSGSWFRVDAPGDGWVIQVGQDRQTVIAWYTFDPEGNPAWMVGYGTLGDDARLAVTLQRPRGAWFGDDFDPDEVERLAWGQLELVFTGCDSARVTWTPTEPGWPAGSANLQRLTRPTGSPDCE